MNIRELVAELSKLPDTTPVVVMIDEPEDRGFFFRDARFILQENCTPAAPGPDREAGDYDALPFFPDRAPPPGAVLTVRVC